MSTSTSKIMIRGVSSGTLVLVNGAPINLRRMYNLEDIPIENVERVEIIKGGGSVLYGSEATGGVINIITKKALQNSFELGLGNFGQQNYRLNLQSGKLSAGYSYEKWGDVGKVSSYFSNGREMNNFFPELERNNLLLNYKFNDQWRMLYNYSKSMYNYNYVFGSGYENITVSGVPGVNLYGVTRYTRHFTDTKNFLQLQYSGNHLSGNIYFNHKDVNTKGADFYSTPNSSTGATTKYDSPRTPSSAGTERNRTYGFDVQKDWQLKNSKALLGATYQNEYYTDEIDDVFEYDRNNYSIYGQWEHNINNANTLILSGRETMTSTSTRQGMNYNNFSGQVQWLHKIDENQSFYASAGQSFMMPTLAQMYAVSDTKVPNPDLKPQTGVHYEIGWKRDHNAHQWRISLFDFSIKDNIAVSYTSSTNTYRYTNEDMKNTGIEIGGTINGSGPFSYNWGVTYSDPLTKTTSKPYWDRNYGRWQLNGGTTYQKDRWQVSVTFNYLADRVMSASTTKSTPAKPYLLTTLAVNYAINENQDIFAKANNLLNRQDVISHSSSEYYYTPFNFLLGYKSKF